MQGDCQPRQITQIRLGGADVKILIGLWGLWPAAGIVGMLAAAIWGLALILTRKGRDRFPAVMAMAIGVTIAFLWI